MDELSTKINKFLSSIRKIEIFIEKIKNKIAEINAIYIEFEFNKNLAFTKTNSYLKFQVEILNNEKTYYMKVKKTLVRKLSTEMYEISTKRLYSSFDILISSVAGILSNGWRRNSDSMLL